MVWIVCIHVKPILSLFFQKCPYLPFVILSVLWNKKKQITQTTLLLPCSSNVVAHTLMEGI